MKNLQHPTQTYPALVDNFNRLITYVRVALTDRCNLRCTYCMPSEGIPFIPHKKILTYEELSRLIKIFILSGIKKIRLTGGEPFVRKDAMSFIYHLKNDLKVPQLHITTNGVETYRYIPELAQLNISGINLSLDTLNREKFRTITRRDSFDEVLKTFELALQYEIPLKINCVVQSGVNEDELYQLAELTKEHPIQVRFIEEMPFNGNYNSMPDEKIINAKTIFQRLREKYPSITSNMEQKGTARIYHIEGFQGTVGIIGGYSRIFCDTCNRLRITPTGILKTCLYDKGSLNMKEFLQKNPSDDEIYNYLNQIIKRRYRNGFEAEKARSEAKKQSMAQIGG